MKRNLLKALGIAFLIFVILTWIIPTGYYANGQFTKNGIDAVGLFDLVSVPVTALVTFALYTAVFAAIGGLYGVMSKTGALDSLVEGIANKFSAKRFLIFTVILFVILSSVTGLALPLFVLVPFFALVLFKHGFGKVTALASTVGAILVGSMASTYGFNISGYTKNVLSLDMNFQILAKVILLVLLTVLLLVFILKHSAKKGLKETIKAEIKEEVKEVKKEVEKKKATVKKVTAKKPVKKTTTRKTTKKATTKNMAVATQLKTIKNNYKNPIPLAIIFGLMIVVTLIGMYNWYYSFGIKFFNDIHTSIMAVKIGDFPIFEHLLSGINAIGYWGNTEFIIIMVIAAIIIAFVYKLSFGQFVESFIAGVKKMMPTAIYAALASVILMVLYQAAYQGTGSIADTSFNTIMGLSEGFNVLTTGLAALLGSFFYNDLYYLLSGLQAYITAFDAPTISIAGLLVQSLYALGMLLLPTSVILIAGLSYFDVSFKKWIKYIWKFAVAALLLILLVCAILTLI